VDHLKPPELVSKRGQETPAEELLRATPVTTTIPEESMPMAKKILVVGDERHIVQRVHADLERAGYEVVTAFDGKEALEQVDAEKPDLIVLDIVMPEMDGFEVLKILRTRLDTQKLPAVLLTPRAGDADVFRNWQSGVDCYLSKPFHPLELVAFVKRIFAALDGTDGKDSGRYTIN
jgi:DNA-binding response OmpR family regulator